ncbi:MAG: hypothetical protein A2Y33_04230 [Spirochaetes bacterium GWF1_51_8]|nr:MAG: hypothetical protein A2Y33_04230 [Spirochaetes bacterium GWF1_51_8]
MPKKKILMPILEAGAGHKMPALAVKDSIEELYPGKYQIDVVDFAVAAGALSADKRMKAFWDACLKNKAFAKATYSLMEWTHPVCHLVLPVGFGSFIRKGREFVRQYNPDLIFSSHYYSLTVAAMARDKLKLPAKVIGCITDPFDAYAFWCEKRADYIVVSSERSKKKCIRRGVQPWRIKVLPFPVNNKFLRPSHNREETRKAYGIDPSKPTILTSEGGQGIGMIARFVREMYRKGVPVNILNVCGKNTALKEELDRMVQTEKSATNLIPLGFVNNMNELLAASDLCIAKAGASTTFEALFMNVPIIFTSWANQAEKPNIDYCVENNAGWYTPDTATFWKTMDEILSTDILKTYRKNIENLHLKSGADDIARFVVEQLEGKAE